MILNFLSDVNDNKQHLPLRVGPIMNSFHKMLHSSYILNESNLV